MCGQVGETGPYFEDPKRAFVHCGGAMYCKVENTDAYQGEFFFFSLSPLACYSSGNHNANFHPIALIYGLLRVFLQENVPRWQMLLKPQFLAVLKIIVLHW